MSKSNDNNCCVLGCSSNNEKNKTAKTTFHRFPDLMGRREEWIAAIDRPSWLPDYKSAVCSLHFTSKDFASGSRKKLRDKAVPSLLLKSKECGENNSIKSEDEAEESSEDEKLTDIAKKKASEDLHALSESELLEIYKKLQLQKMKTYRMGQALRVQAKRSKAKVSKLKKRVSSMRSEIRKSQKVQKNDIVLRQGNTNVKLSLELKAFAVTLHFLSPEAYNYVQGLFDTTLPPVTELENWRVIFEDSEEEAPVTDVAAPEIKPIENDDSMIQ